MAKQFLTPINLNKYELQNARLQNLASAPASPVDGQMYYDTTLNKPRIYTAAGATWKDMVGADGTVTGVGATAPIQSSGGTSPTISILDATTSASGAMSGPDKTKLDGVATGATANSTDATLLARANHTGTQASTTISDFTEAAQDAIGSILNDTATLDLAYNDAGNSITGTVLDSPTVAGATPAQLRDRATHTGTQTAATISDFNEAAQDAVGTVLTDSATVDFTYNDAGNTITAAVLDSPTVAGTTPAQLRDRSTHTGSQTASTISDFNTAVRTNTLNQMAAPTASVSMNSQLLTNVATPVSGTDAANKNYVDGLAQGIDTKDSVRVATTGNITLSGTQTIDGVVLVAGNRVLVKNQTTTNQNGIYVVAAGAWARAVDMDTWAEVPGAFTFVEQGQVNADTGWVSTADAGGTIGTTAITWTQFSGAGSYLGGNGLTLTGNTFAVGTNATAMTSGLSVSADEVNIDTAVVVRKYSENISASTAHVCTHNLNTRDVTVGVYLNSGTYEEVECDIEHTSVNTVTIRFAVAPAANAYRVVVHG